MSRPILRAVKPTLILLVGALLIFAVATMKPVPKPRPSAALSLIDVSIVPVKFSSKRIEIKSQGTVMPRREVDLVSQVSGNVVAVDDNFVAGGFVSPDKVLVQVDQRDYELALIRSRARVAEAEQVLALEKGRSRQAKREWRDLGNEDANQLFLRVPQLKSAKAQVESAKADMKQAQLNLRRTRLAVPFAGRIRETMVDLGQYVTTGTKVARVYDSGVVEIRLPLTDRQAALVDIPWQPASAGNGARVTVFGKVAGREQEWAGRIVRSDASVDTRSRFYYVVAEVENTDQYIETGQSDALPLMVGLFVEARIEGKELTNVLEVPKSAVFERNRLFIVNKNNEAYEKTIDVMQIKNDSILIQGDFSQDDRIVIEKQTLIASGMKVNPVPVTL